MSFIIILLMKTKKDNLILEGVVASSSQGNVQGEVFFYNGRKELPQNGGNYILVTKYALPEIADVILGNDCFSGLISDNGGVLSHLAVVSREVSMPFITATNRALDVLNEGDVVKMDASSYLGGKGAIYKK